MRSTLITAALTAITLVPLFAQQDVPPPPKPKDDGPSLEATTRFIVGKLNSLGAVNYISYAHDNIKGDEWTNEWHAEYSKITALEGTSGIRYHELSTRGKEELCDRDFEFRFRDVQDISVISRSQQLKQRASKDYHPEWDIRADPPIFALLIRGKGGFNDFFFLDEDLAHRVAKAIAHAVELSGGGSKDPF